MTKESMADKKNAHYEIQLGIFGKAGKSWTFIHVYTISLLYKLDLGNFK